jgi:hypothetical protein
MNMIVAGAGHERRTHQHEEDPAAGGHRQTDTGGCTQEHGETILVRLKPVFDFIMSAKSHNCFIQNFHVNLKGIGSNRRIYFAGLFD